MNSSAILRSKKLYKALLPRSTSNLNYALGTWSGLSKSISTSAPTLVKNGVITDEKDIGSLKSLDEMPGPKPILPYFGTEWVYSRFGPYTRDTMHHVARQELYEKYGDIYKEHLGGATVVSLHTNKQIKAVMLAEGAYPSRAINEANVYWRTKNKDKYSTVGLLDNQGHEWSELRSLVIHTILKDNAGPIFTERLSSASEELIKLLKMVMGPDGYIADIRPYLFRLGLEAMWRCLFGRELGALMKDPPVHATALIDLVIQLFTSFAELSLSRPLWKICPSASPTFRKFSEADSGIYDIVIPYTQDVLADMTSEELKSKKFSFISRFLRNEKFDRRLLTTLVVDFVAAGIPSTAYFLSLILHRICEEPKLQRRLQAAIDPILPTEETLITENIYNGELKLLKYTIKEGTRLTTIIPGISRILAFDMSIDGYFLPKNTPVLCQTRVASRLNQNFSDALEFIPDRWLHRYPNLCECGEEKLEQYKVERMNNNFLVLPFGYGKRMCIGKSLSEREMAITLTKLLRSFNISTKGDIGLGNLFLLAPTKPVPIWLEPRKPLADQSTA